MNLREEFEKETGWKYHPTDMMIDKYIQHLESELKKERAKIKDYYNLGKAYSSKVKGLIMKQTHPTMENTCNICGHIKCICNQPFI